MAARDDWIEDLRRWCFEAPLAEVEALVADVTASSDSVLAPGFPSSEAERSPAGGPTAFTPYARGDDFDRTPSPSPHDLDRL